MVLHTLYVDRSLKDALLMQTLARFNRTYQQLTSAQIIAELIELSKEVVAERDRGKTFNPALSNDELAFYDVVALNKSAVDVMGTDILAQIARDLVATMLRDARTD